MAKPLYYLGFLGSMSVATAWIVFMYATTFQIHANVLLSASMFIVGGLLLAKMLVGLEIQPFELKRVTESIMWAGASAIVIYMVNLAVPVRLDVGVMSTKVFSVCMGVAEECTFRVFLCPFIFKYTNNFWLAVGISAGSWTIYHIARYGGNLGAMLILFVAGLMLGAVMLYSRVADGVIFAHGFINYIA